jgi:hypothetical protein
LSVAKIDAGLGSEAIDSSSSVAAARSAFAGFRFPPEVIVVAVRWYLRFGLSYRDVEELLLERGLEVDHLTVYRWVPRFTPLLLYAARFSRHRPGDQWFVDETYVKVKEVVFALDDELLIFPHTGLAERDSGPWPCADGNLRGNPAANYRSDSSDLWAPSLLKRTAGSRPVVAMCGEHASQDQ